MRREIIKTKFDGPVPFIWKDKEDFSGRSISISTWDQPKVSVDQIFKEISRIDIPDEAPVICDLCNDEITEFPVPVMNDSYALCPKCFKKVKEG